MQPFVGKQWILKYETAEKPSRDIELRGLKHPYVVQSQDGYERTTFEDVFHRPTAHASDRPSNTTPSSRRWSAMGYLKPSRPP